MHALSVLQNLLDDALPFLHRARLNALFAAVGALLCGGRLSLTALGRQMPLPEHGRRRHQIKRVDRLLKNAALHAERSEFFKALAHQVIGATVRVPLIVDWTPIGADSKHHALIASVPIGGRVVIVYAEVHPLKMLSNPRVERKFLQRLKVCIPAHCQPIVITDAGFRVPWFQSVAELGWDFLGRGRGNVQVQLRTGSWISIRQLFGRATRQPSDLGRVSLTQQKAYAIRMILVRGKRTKRKTHRASKRRKLPTMRVMMSQSERHRTVAREPWVLITSCMRFSPRRIVSFYKRRMAVEETFRDMKSHRFGWSLEDARSRSPHRYEVLLLIAALALFIVILTGLLAERLKMHHGHQANTVRHKRVISVFFLGRMVLADHQDYPFKHREIRATIRRVSCAFQALKT